MLFSREAPPVPASECSETAMQDLCDLRARFSAAIALNPPRADRPIPIEQVAALSVVGKVPPAAPRLPGH